MYILRTHMHKIPPFLMSVMSELAPFLTPITVITSDIVILKCQKHENKCQNLFLPGQNGMI